MPFLSSTLTPVRRDASYMFGVITFERGKSFSLKASRVP